MVFISQKNMGQTYLERSSQCHFCVDQILISRKMEFNGSMGSPVVDRVICHPKNENHCIQPGKTSRQYHGGDVRQAKHLNSQECWGVRAVSCEVTDRPDDL